MNSVSARPLYKMLSARFCPRDTFWSLTGAGIPDIGAYGTSESYDARARTGRVGEKVRVVTPAHCRTNVLFGREWN